MSDTTVCRNCGFPESDHESVDYRGDKGRACSRRDRTKGYTTWSPVSSLTGPRPTDKERETWRREAQGMMGHPAGWRPADELRVRIITLLDDHATLRAEKETWLRQLDDYARRSGDDLATLRAESDGRLAQLLRKAEEARAEWIRAEAAEASRDAQVGQMKDLVVEIKADRDALKAQVAALSSQLNDYVLAAKYPGDDQRHRGASVATQLVHCQHMREKAEAQVAALTEALEMIAVRNIARAALPADAPQEGKLDGTL